MLICVLSASDSHQQQTKRNLKLHQRNIPPQLKQWTGTMAFIPPNDIAKSTKPCVTCNWTEDDANTASDDHARIDNQVCRWCIFGCCFICDCRSLSKQGSRWNSVPPKLCTLHWNRKMTVTLTNHCVTEERSTVIVGNAIQLKLLGVPSYFKVTDGPVKWRNHCTTNNEAHDEMAL